MLNAHKKTKLSSQLSSLQMADDKQIAIVCDSKAYVLHLMTNWLKASKANKSQLIWIRREISIVDGVIKMRMNEQRWIAVSMKKRTSLRLCKFTKKKKTDRQTNNKQTDRRT